MALKHRITDPVERVIADALDAACIAYEVERDDTHLDFRLANGVYIECKRYHTPRIAEQMTRAENVIVVQGMDAARWLASIIGNS